MTTEPDLAARALAIHEALAPIHGAPVPYFQSLDPLTELISTMLNHRTRNRDAKAAFEALRARWPGWAAVRDAPVEEVEEVIARVNWPERKAPAIQHALREIAVRRGSLDLGFLGEMPVEEARAWLEEIPSVGPKTSAAVLSFSTLRRPALPVDSHHHRVAQRTGLIGPRLAAGPAHAVLEGYVPDDWDAQAVYDHHQLFMRHGQQVCRWRAPDCGRCAILHLCPEGRARLDRAA